jgi:outer membrane protein assembly factor BamB
MRRIYPYAVLVLLAWSTGGDRALAAPGVRLIPETAAARHGLTRPWFTQAQVDRTQGKIESLLLYDGTLFVQTDRAVLQAIDAETGRTLWTKEVGNRNYPSLRPAANGEMVAVINGSTLYILHRQTGRLLWQRTVEGVPGAGPALSELRAFVPMTNGLVLAYRLEAIEDPAVELGLLNPESEEDAEELKARRLESMRLQQDLKPPLACQSFGRAMVQPLITRESAGEEFVAWPTDRGYVFVGRIDRRRETHFEMMYKLETAAEITASPTFLPPATEDPADSGIIFAPSLDGFLHAIRERDGTSMWRFSTGEPVFEPAAPIADKVYVATQLGGMYCLAVTTGQQLWWTPGIMRFVAASKDRVYAEDRNGNIVILHSETGGRLDVIPAAGLPLKLMNLQTDRLYLAAESGLVQCLHEIEQKTPILHRPKPAPKTQELKPEAVTPTVPAQPGAAPGANPFGTGLDAGGGGVPAADDPFGGGAAPAADNPFGGGAAPAADNPFGGGATAPMDDPFGGGADPAESPFGGGPMAPADNPFGTGGAAPAGGTDPFGGGSAPVDDPFS